MWVAQSLPILSSKCSSSGAGGSEALTNQITCRGKADPIGTSGPLSHFRGRMSQSIFVPSGIFPGRTQGRWNRPRLLRIGRGPAAILAYRSSLLPLSGNIGPDLNPSFQRMTISCLDELNAGVCKRSRHRKFSPIPWPRTERH